MIKWIASVLIVFTTLVVAISWFLAPDSLMKCSQSPSALEGCHRADVIIAVSGGDTAMRTQLAIDMYQKGWAPRLIFSGAAQDKSGPSNANVMRQQALRQGVPAHDVAIEEQSETTKQNAEKTSDILQTRNIKTAIIVSSSYHMKRTLMEFRTRAPGVEFRAHPTAADNQWTVWWWTTPNGWYLAISEVAKIMVAYIGGSR